MMLYRFVYIFIMMLSGMLPANAQPGKTTISVLYDNFQYSDATIADWGYSCLIIRENDTILFDTGARKEVLFHNLNAMDVDLSTVQTVVISHHHGDHVGNIFPVLEKCGYLQVFLPSSLDGKFRNMVDNFNVHTEVDQSNRQIAHNIFLTGEMGFQIREQGIVIKTSQGLVLLVACGHPGIDRMVKKVSRTFGEKVYMVMGGFHLDEFTDSEIDDIIKTFKAYGVEKLVPGHCTGSGAMEKFREAFGNGFVESGTGKVVSL